MSSAQGRPRELESLSEHQPPPGKGLPGPGPLEERAMSLKAKMSGPQGRPQNPHVPSRVTSPILEGRDSIFNPHHFAFNTGLGKHLDLNHAVCSAVVKDLNFVIRLSGCLNISFLNYEMG